MTIKCTSTTKSVRVGKLLTEWELSQRQSEPYMRVIIRTEGIQLGGDQGLLIPEVQSIIGPYQAQGLQVETPDMNTLVLTWNALTHNTRRYDDVTYQNYQLTDLAHCIEKRLYAELSRHEYVVHAKYHGREHTLYPVFEPYNDAGTYRIHVHVTAPVEQEDTRRVELLMLQRLERKLKPHLLLRRAAGTDEKSYKLSSLSLGNTGSGMILQVIPGGGTNDFERTCQHISKMLQHMEEHGLDIDSRGR